MAAGDRDADGVDQSDARALDHLRRHLLEIEADDEFREDLPQPFVQGRRLAAALRRDRSTRRAGERQRGAGREKRAAVERNPVVRMGHGRTSLMILVLRECRRFYAARQWGEVVIASHKRVYARLRRAMA